MNCESESENGLDLSCYPKKLIEFSSSRECAVGFRIRNPDSDDFAEYHKVYRQYLSRFKDMSGTHLWKFFYWDFFHDGEVGSIQVQSDLKTIVVGLSCPNIKRLKPDGWHEDISVGFTCTFRNVSTLTIQYEPPEHDWDVRKNPTYFMDAEINTSPILDGFGPEDEDDENGPEPHCSLLMRLLADESTVWVELVFSGVDVTADEPTAFALMETDPKFRVPTYSKEKGKPGD